MLTGDAAFIKKINRSIIISNIIEHEMISRASLAKLTGLNKATISVQVSDLLSEQLIIETQHEHNSLGRRPIMLSINKHAGYVLGIDLDKHKITFTLSDLTGSTVHTDTENIPSSDYDTILGILVKHIEGYKGRCAKAIHGIVRIAIGIHGIVNNDETIYFVPQHRWRDKDLKRDLERETGVKVCIENNANLCAIAERVYKHHQSEDLLCVCLYSGIGLGILANGAPLKGYHGYAGEIGHMIVVPNGKLCRCGNRGCWEQYASETTFLEQLSKSNDNIRDYENIHHWINEIDTKTSKDMEQFIQSVALGLNNIINLYNPEILVINSEVLRLYPRAIDDLEKHLTSTISHYRKLLISDLGKKACIMGACALAIKDFLEVSELRLTVDNK